MALWSIVRRTKMVRTVSSRYSYTIGPIQKTLDLIDSYLNGSRTLSNERLSYLIVSCADTANPDVPGPKPTVQSYELLICATHFLGDGMALHQFANDFFGILGSSQTNEELSSVLNTEIRTRYAKFSESVSSIWVDMTQQLSSYLSVHCQAPSKTGCHIRLVRVLLVLLPGLISRGAKRNLL